MGIAGAANIEGSVLDWLKRADSPAPTRFNELSATMLTGP